ncbi:MAG: hypothetical protein V2A54_11815, partial [Bacteroidota bacterium]
MKKIMLFLFVAAIFSACSSKKKSNEVTSFVYQNNCENDTYGVNFTSFRVDSLAHSGKLASVLDSTTEFGTGFSSPFKNISVKGPRKVIIKLWAYFFDKTTKGQIVCSILNGKESIDWKSQPIEKYVKSPGKWCQVKTEFFIPQDLDESFIYQCYIWNPGKCHFLIDDFE